MTTNYEVCGYRVLLKPLFAEKATDWGFKLDVGEDYQREKAATQEGIIIQIGDMAWKAFDGDQENWRPWAAVGDKVVFARYGGKFLTLEGEDYMIVSDQDIQLVLEKADAK